MGSTVSTLGQLLDNNSRLRTIQGQLAELQTQLASGKKSQDFSGLEETGILSQRARVNLSQLEVYQSNISVGVSRIKEINQTLAEFRQQSENFTDFMAGEQQDGKINYTNIKTFAKDTLAYLRNLINTKEDDRYTLGGADSFTPPMNDTGAHGTYMAGLFKDWRTATLSTDQLINTYSTTPETTIGYSPALSSGQVRNIYVRADVNVDVDYTILANSKGIKDVINTLAIISEIDLDKIALEPGDNPSIVKTAPGSTPEEQKQNFFKFYEDAIKRINGGINAVEDLTVRLQKSQLTLETIAQDHKLDQVSLEGLLDRVENADTSEIAVKVNSLQIQLTAAYQVTALMGNLSLSNYL